MVALAPVEKVINHSPLLPFINTSYTSNHCRVIRECLEEAGLFAVVKVCGVTSEEEGSEDSPPWSFVLVGKLEGIQKYMAHGPELL